MYPAVTVRCQFRQWIATARRVAISFAAASFFRPSSPESRAAMKPASCGLSSV